jgi:uncharacterized OB-fold protein
MPRPIPEPDELSKPFWDAANEKRLVVHFCTACNTWQHPPREKCRDCGSDQLEWREPSGKGHISTCMVVDDGRIGRMQPEQPFNLAVITLDEDPRVNFYSNLPGVPVREAPHGAPVEVFFDSLVGSDQLVPEWRLVK